MFYAAYGGHVDVLRVLIAHHADLNAVDVAGWTAIMWAIPDGHVHATAVLHRAGASIKVR